MQQLSLLDLPELAKPEPAAEAEPEATTIVVAETEPAAEPMTLPRCHFCNGPMQLMWPDRPEKWETCQRWWLACEDVPVGAGSHGCSVYLDERRLAWHSYMNRVAKNHDQKLTAAETDGLRALLLADWRERQERVEARRVAAQAEAQEPKAKRTRTPKAKAPDEKSKPAILSMDCKICRDMGADASQVEYSHQGSLGDHVYICKARNGMHICRVQGIHETWSGWATGLPEGWWWDRAHYCWVLTDGTRRKPGLTRPAEPAMVAPDVCSEQTSEPAPPCLYKGCSGYYQAIGPEQWGCTLNAEHKAWIEPKNAGWLDGKKQLAAVQLIQLNGAAVETVFLEAPAWAAEQPFETPLDLDLDCPSGPCLFTGCQGTYQPSAADRWSCDADPTHRAWLHQPTVLAYRSIYGTTNILLADWLASQAQQLQPDPPKEKPARKPRAKKAKPAQPDLTLSNETPAVSEFQTYPHTDCVNVDKSEKPADRAACRFCGEPMEKIPGHRLWHCLSGKVHRFWVKGKQGVWMGPTATDEGNGVVPLPAWAK